MNNHLEDAEEGHDLCFTGLDPFIQMYCVVCHLPAQERGCVSYSIEPSIGGRITHLVCKPCSEKTDDKWKEHGWEKHER